MPISIERAIAEAERQIKALASTYPQHLSSVTSELDTLAQAGDWAAIGVIAHDIKGQAATVGWPLLGDIARSLQRCLDSAATKLYGEAVALHVAAIRVCLSKGIADHGTEGDRLLTDLIALGNHMAEVAHNDPIMPPITK